MFKVDKDAMDIYHISIGVGKIYRAKDLQEVKIALDHYWAKDSCRLGNNSNCPLCRAINEEMARKSRGKS